MSDAPRIGDPVRVFIHDGESSEGRIVGIRPATILYNGAQDIFIEYGNRQSVWVETELRWIEGIWEVVF